MSQHHENTTPGRKRAPHVQNVSRVEPRPVSAGEPAPSFRVATTAGALIVRLHSDRLASVHHPDHGLSTEAPLVVNRVPIRVHLRVEIDENGEPVAERGSGASISRADWLDRPSGSDVVSLAGRRIVAQLAQDAVALVLSAFRGSATEARRADLAREIEHEQSERERIALKLREIDERLAELREQHRAIELRVGPARS